MTAVLGPRPYGPSEFLLGLEQAYCIAPATVLICNLPFFLPRYFNSTPCVRPSSLMWSKLITAVALAAVQLSRVASCWQSGVETTAIEWLAAAFSFTGTLSLVAITYIGHRYFAQSVPLLNLYLAYTLLFDVVVVDTYFNHAGPGLATRTSQTAVVLLKIALLVLEQVSKRKVTLPGHHLSYVEQNGDVPLFQLLRRIFTSDFRPNLSLQDVHHMEKELAQEKLEQSFIEQWTKVDKESPDALKSACFATLRGQFCSGILPRLLAVAFNLAQPLLVRDLLIAVSTQAPPAEVLKRLIIAAAVIYPSIALLKTFNAWHSYVRSKYIIQFRGILSAALYSKSLKLKSEGQVTSELVSILNAELDAVMVVLVHCYDEWAGVLEIVFHAALLVYLVGFSSVFVLAPVIIPMRIGMHLTRSSPKFRQIWTGHVEDRVAATSNILAQIKDIKMLGLEPVLAQLLQDKQHAEIKSSLRMRETLAIRFCASAFTQTVTPITAIGIAIFGTQSLQPLSVAEFFTILAVTVGIIRAAAKLVRFSSLNESKLGSLDLMQQYLLQAENIDKRSLTREPRPNPHINASADDSGQILTLRRSRRIAVNQFVVKFVNVTLSGGLTGPLLRDIHLKLSRGKVAMLFGGTPSGKSAVLRAIIGRVKPIQGHILVSTTTSIAYCSQEPWIQNMSIRNNIIGPNDYDFDWFNTVIRICALDVDLARFPDRDLTIAGRDGCNLSGGQKQRVALARSLFAKPELLILDDIFSSLDMDTSSTIRIRLFGQSRVLQTHNITVVMSTSMSEHLVDADIVFEVTSQGRVMVRSNASRENSPRYLPARWRTTEQPSEDNTSQHMQPTNHPEHEPPIVRTTSNRQETEPGPLKANFGDISLYWYALAPAGIKALFFWAFTVTSAAVVEKMPYILASVWLHAAPNNHSFYLLYAIVAILNPVTNFIAAASYLYIIYPRAAAALHWSVAETTFKATFDHLMSLDASNLLSKFTRDVSATTECLTEYMMPLTWGVVALFIDLIVISIPFASSIPAISFLAVFYALWVLSKDVSCQLGILEEEGKRELTKLVDETNTGVEHIYAFNWQESFLKQFHARLSELQAVCYRRRHVSDSLRMLLDYASAAVTTAAVAVALCSPQVPSTVAMGHAIIRLMTFSEENSIIMEFWTRLEDSLGAVSRIQKFQASAPQEATVTRCPPVSAQWPLRGKVELNCVTACYKPGDGSAFIALKNVSVRVSPGQMVCIAGRTGSGKTSVFLSILRMIEFAGSISIDDREIRTIPHDILRSSITTITQSGLQLKGSVRFNMDPINSVLRPRELLLTDDTLIDILRRVRLWHLVEARGGLDADIDSLSLSYGQKQLFQLARAILHQQNMMTRIVLIDEGTSALDPVTDLHMHQVIREVFHDCTVLIVSHRPAMFADADLIVRLADGAADVYRHERARNAWRPTPLVRR